MSNADQSASWIDSSPWLDEYDGATSVRTARQSPLEQIDATPSEAYLQGVLAAENAAIADLAALSRLVGPHEQTWKYRWGIEKEILRLSSACRESVGTERESNLRQLRDAEAARSEFCETPEFRAAVAYALAVVDRVIEAAGNDLTPAQVATKGRYDAIRASLEAMTAHTPEQPAGIKPEQAQHQSGPAEAPRSTQTTLDMGVSKAEILAVFPPLEGQSRDQWDKMLGDARRAKWLRPARIDAGGKAVQSRWNPAQLAMCLHEKKHMGRGALGVLIQRHFPEYLKEWEAYVCSFNSR